MSDIKEFIAAGRRVFISGIGGVSTSALANLFRLRGIVVSGSDQSDGDVTARLREVGIAVHIGHAAENLGDAECVVRSAAIHDDNVEIVEARRRGLPVFERADAWGAIMLEHRHAICISGTHGKTTTTTFAAQIAMDAGLDPTLTVGASVPGIGTHRVGGADLIIAEACEYCNSFLRFRPTTAVVLNIEEDHLDFFKDLDDIKRSFERFARMLPDDGRLCCCVDNDGARELAEKMASDSGYKPQVITFGLDGGAAVRAENLSETRGRYSFDLVFDGEKAGGLPSARMRVELGLCGRHNVTDALGAAASLWGAVDAEAIARSLSSAKGPSRRFEFKRSVAIGGGSVDVYDDYAHHPQEMEACFAAARAALEGSDGRLVAVFQPHTFSRVRALFDGFAEVLKKPDAACLLPIYAAREEPDPEVTSERLAAAAGIDCASTFDEAADWARRTLRAGDMFVTVGAGEAYKVGDLL